MARSWAEITNEIMTSLYLYGQETKPTNLVGDSLIRNGSALDGTTFKTIDLDAVSFMISGPGRYGYGAESPVVKGFMSWTDIPHIPGQRSEFTLAQMESIFGTYNFDIRPTKSYA